MLEFLVYAKQNSYRPDMLVEKYRVFSSMTYYSKAQHSDFAELKQLWNVVFNEEKTFLDAFFSKRFDNENIFIARFNDKIISALHALKSTYNQGGDSFDCSYIVGASTLQEFRNQGHMGKLLELASKSYNHPMTSIQPSVLIMRNTATLPLVLFYHLLLMIK